MEVESESEEISKTPGPGPRNGGSMQQTIDVQMEDVVPNPKPSSTARALDQRGKEEPGVAGSKPKATRKAKSRNPKHACQPGQPRWIFVPPTSAADIIIPPVSPTLPPSRPRIWASRRSELLATLPELAGSSCIHGISWSLSPAPLILLEGQTAWGDVSADGLTMDINMTREFECCKSDIAQENPRPTGANTEVPIATPIPAGPDEGASKPKKPRLGYTNTPRASFRSNTLPPPAHRLNHTTWLITGDNTKNIPSPPEPSFNFGPPWLVDDLRNPAILDNGGGQPQLAPASGVIEPGASGVDINIPPVSYGGHGPGIIPSAWLSSDLVEPSNPAEYWRAPATPTDPMLCSEFDANLLTKMDCQPSPIEKANITTGPCSNSNRSVSLCCFQETSTTQPHPGVPSMSYQEPSHPKRRRVLSETCDGTIKNERPAQSDAPALDQDTHGGGELEKKTPAPIPPEIQTIIDTYIHGLPIVIIANRNHLPPQWNMALPEEYAYTYLGYFQVIRVWETIGQVTHSKSGAPELDIISACVDWRFRCQWIPGGEDWVAREKKYLSPWWTVRPKATPVVLPDDVDSDQESSPPYRLRRTRSPNYPKRRTFFGQVYHPLIPLHLIAPYGTQTPDTAFPRGWYCGTCGKINYQIMLRHRDCSSAFCRTKPPSLGFALSLAAVRDPQSSHFIFSPDDTHPSSVTESTARWDDGSSTITYTASTANPVLTVQHIFTHNSPTLQEEPSEYFQAIQINAKLIRSSEDTSPYFSCSVGAKKSVDGVSYSWRSTPKCLSDVREFLHFRGQAYGEKDQTVCFVNSLQVLAYVTSGTRKGTDLLDARSHCVVILCLGSNTVLTVIPKSTLNTNEKQASALDSLISMDVDEVEDKELEDRLNGPNSTPVEPPSAPSAPPKKAAGKRAERPAISLSLVHGDNVVLHGDEFEYSIKRSGTGMLLFGSYVK